MGKMGKTMNNNGTDLFEGTLDALDGITEGTGLNVKPVEVGMSYTGSFDEKLAEIISDIHLAAVGYSDGEPNVLTTQAELYKQAINQLIASELGAIIDANIDPDHAIDTDRVYEALVEWIGELQGGGDE